MQPNNDPTQPSYPPPPPYTQYPPFQPPPPPKKRRPWLIYGIVALLVIGVGITYGNMQNAASTAPQAAPTPTDTPFPTVALAPTDTPTPTKPLAWTTVQKFSGSGSKKTQTFTIGDNWRIKWSCDPNSFGGTAFNVIIEVDNADGSFSDLPVNTMCKPGNTADTSYEAAGGTYLLSITSEGDWSIQVQEQR